MSSALFTLGAPIALWMTAINTAQKTRLNDVPVVNEWSPNKTSWPYPMPPAPPPSPVSQIDVVVSWSSDEDSDHSA